MYDNVIDAAFSCIKNYSTGSGKIRDYGTTLSEMKIRAGWWRPSRYTYLDDENQGLRECPLGTDACKGGSGPWDGTDMYCAKGYTGPMCMLCLDGFTFNDQTQTCETCDQPGGGLSPSPALFVISGILLIIVVAILRYVRRRLRKSKLSCLQVLENIGDAAQAGEDRLEEQIEENVEAMLAEGDTPHEENWKVRLLRLKKSLAVKAKILITFFQIVSTMSFNLGGISFPPMFQSFSTSMNFVNLNVLSVVPFGCIDTGTNFYLTLSFVTIGPILIGAILILLNVMTKNDVFFSYLLMLSFFVLPSSSTTVLQSLKCDVFHDPKADVDVSYLEVDYSIECERDGDISRQRAFWIIYSCVMIIIYPIGIPTMMMVNLSKHRYDLCPPLEDPKKHPESKPKNDELEKDDIFSSTEGKGRMEKDAAKDASNKSTLVTVETENAWEYKGQKFSSSLVRITHIL